METDKPDQLNILQVNNVDVGGGAARVAMALHHAYRRRGHNAWLAVGHKVGSDAHTLPIRHDRAVSMWRRPFWQAESNVATRRSRAARWLRYALQLAAEPRRLGDWLHGYEDFRFPGTAHLPDMPDSIIDMLHLHNLHGRYFDLRQLPRLTAAAPTILSLHDAWLLSGHCAHSLECQRWREGCGSCPDLSLYPAILRDGTAENWQRKQAIYARSRYHIISPCQWLADKVAGSPLRAGLLGLRVIPHGVDLTRFRPGDRSAARRELGLPEGTRIILMVANQMRSNPWKGFHIARAAFAALSEKKPSKPILVLVIGDSTDEEHLGDVTIRYIPFERDQAAMVSYYQAADIFLSASIAEVWGLAITEAMACGVPVVAAEVGGVPEQVMPWSGEEPGQATGILVPAADPAAIANALTLLLEDEALRLALGQNAARRALAEFDFNTQVDRYLAFYREILAARETA